MSIGDYIKTKSTIKLTSEWVPVFGYEGYYRLTACGRIYSEQREVSRLGLTGDTTIPAKEMKIKRHSPKGKYFVLLSRNSEQTVHYVADLVWEAFSGPIPNDHVVIYLDGDSANHCLDNLAIERKDDFEAKKFWSKVDIGDKDDCWPFLGCFGKHGYGVVGFRRKFWRAHRLALVLYLGRPLNKNELACHKCDNRKCCNPNHLFVGSPADNMHDMIKKGRKRVGSRASQTKLNEEIVRKSKQLKEAGMTWIAIAKKFDMHPCTISKAINGKRWKHV